MEKLDLHPRIMLALKKSKLKSFPEILSLSNPDLKRATNLSSRDVQILKGAVAESIPMLPIVTAFNLTKQSNVPPALKVEKLSTSCEILDKALRGGFISRGITEIVGESACGKTQLCLQLSLMCQLPEEAGGLAGDTMYICTEDAFPTKRFTQLIEAWHKKGIWKKLSDGCLQPGDHVYIEHITDVESLIVCLERKLPVLIKRRKIKLIVLDSVAALFRSEYAIEDTLLRSKHLSSIAKELHHVNMHYNIPVMCVNQVTASEKSNSNIPCLGLSWANHLTTRIQLTKVEQTALPPSVIELFGPHVTKKSVPAVSHGGSPDYTDIFSVCHACKSLEQ
ncbi:repair XRCC3-like isoform X1 [Octopus vulgaris]|uniref:Repair XRCC3-like isoform X1 n=1 Tax=Octopus vulgaris TaxID=6645 RepID=A0AA36B939_OCTVU|nr:repair XRCC3-like isoform X1 [Octopus vulgaris]